ncbi:substrate-binding domain-containing protein [Actinokineospora sp. NBRC 105648]|uniref:substrate-binding domain-containing protein n=1 Tax=Actinokineospora sp. NBRC 105648 TaxID=3032206 RepID=UPI0024A38807|nr:substrate-binding domain-containing protein [Actinokineospora sp. NBRC 105648]GLZ37696.1 VWA domain-containing protein [Actinokineospora sp. NBRC 105648]
MTDDQHGPTEWIPAPPRPERAEPAAQPAAQPQPADFQDQLQLFAAELLSLRTQRGLTLDQLSRRANYSTAQLSRATRGDRLPTWQVTEGYVRGCQEEGDENAVAATVARWRWKWETLHAAAAAAAVAPPVREDEPRPEDEGPVVGVVPPPGGGEPPGDDRVPGGGGEEPPVRKSRVRPVLVAVIGVLALGLVAWLAIRAMGSGDDPDPGKPGAVFVPWVSALQPCAAGDRRETLTVAASADKSNVLTGLAASYQPHLVNGTCVEAKVVLANSGIWMDRLAQGWDEARWGPRPDVWSPASSMWLPLARAKATDAARAALPTGDDFESIVTTPLVIAVPRTVVDKMKWAGTELGWQKLDELARDPAGWAGKGDQGLGPFKLGKTNPTQSSSGLNATLGQFLGLSPGRPLDESVLTDPANQRSIEAVEKAVEHYGDTTLTYLANLRENDGTTASYLSAITIEESSMVAYNEGYPCGAASPGDRCRKGARPAVPLVAFYPPEGTFYSDHPFIPMPGISDAKAKVAADFLGYLHSSQAAEKFGEYGFRTINPDRSAAPSKLVTAANGARPDAQLPATMPRPSGATLKAALQVWQKVRKPANVLLVIDTSGSMGPPTPADQNGYPPGYAGPSKLDRVKGAAEVIMGEGTFTDRDRVGLWNFSTRLNGEADYKVDVELGALGDAAAVGTRRAQIRTALANLKPVGATGLYDTINAAADHLKAHYDPGAINAVVVLTDGKNEDTNQQTDSASLITTLGAEKVSPVRVFAIAYGDGTDFNRDGEPGELQKIAQASHGAAYDATDPASIETVFTNVLSNF